MIWNFYQRLKINSPHCHIHDPESDLGVDVSQEQGQPCEPGTPKPGVVAAGLILRYQWAPSLWVARCAENVQVLQSVDMGWSLGLSHVLAVWCWVSCLISLVYFCCKINIITSITTGCACSVTKSWLSATPWTVAHKTSLSMGFSRNTGVGCHFFLHQ